MADLGSLVVKLSAETSEFREDLGRTARLLATEVLDASLTLLDGVHDHVAELTTGS